MATTVTREGLKRVIGVPALAMSIVNASIGSGIFALPAIVAMQLGSYSIICYVFCALMLATIMFCYAEIGSKVSASGGSYCYVEAAFGPFAGFIINWLYLLGWGILGSAAVMNILADSLSIMFPLFVNAWARALLYFILLGFMVVVNIYGARNGIRFVQVLTVIKLLPLFAIIIFGFNYIAPANLNWQQLPSLRNFGDTALVLFFAFAGFETSLNVSGEVKEPKRTVPVGIMTGGVMVVIIYILLQVVTSGILGSQIVTFKDAPLAAVAEKIIGPAGATIMIFAAVVSCFGITSGDVMATPRLLFAGAVKGFFPKFLGKVHPKYSTPYWAVILYTTLIFIFSISGGFKQLAVMASSAILLIYLAVILSTIKMRSGGTSPVEKSFRVPGGLLIPMTGILSILWLLSGLNRNEIISVIIFIGLITALYILMIKFKKSSPVIVPRDKRQ